MTRLLLLALILGLTGCGDESKKPANAPVAPAPDASIFDKKEMPQGSGKDGPRGE